MISYLPAYYGAAQCRKRLPVALALIGAIIWTAIVAILLAIIFAGLSGFYAVVTPVLAIVGGVAGYRGIFGKLMGNSKKAAQVLQQAALADPAWSEASLLQYVNQVFMAFQNDWSALNIASIGAYTTEGYHYHVQLMIYAMQQLGRQNLVQDIEIKDVRIIEANNAAGTNSDYFVAYIQAKANDRLMDLRDQSKPLFTDNSTFSELWRFERQANQWRLAGITQATEEWSMLNSSLQQFAASERFCYSPDWGWLLLPKRGQLFGKANFGQSDVNNHVIGVYKNVLVQLYTYVPAKNNNQNNSQQYLIAQATVPKQYGNIIVQRKKGLFQRTPKGLTKVSLEWLQFHKKYNVYASDMERVTSFELLHPAYMEKLEALPFELNIEVVDNSVYLYSKRSDNRYPEMLAILKEAFEEMKM